MDFTQPDDEKWNEIRAPRLTFSKGLPEARDSFFDTPTTKECREKNNLQISLIEEIIDSFDAAFPTPSKAFTSTPFPVFHAKHQLTKEPKIFQFTGVKTTKPKPFSFEARDKIQQKIKEERFQKMLKEENEMRKFRANPLPSFINFCPTSRLLRTAYKKQANDNENVQPQFKARPAKVLHIQPFQPNLPKNALPTPKPPPLKTEIRAEARKRFDDYLKEKERQQEEFRKMDHKSNQTRTRLGVSHVSEDAEFESDVRLTPSGHSQGHFKQEAARKRREEEELILLRRSRVFKAQPVPKFKCPVRPVLKRPLTEPTTPIAAKRQRC